MKSLRWYSEMEKTPAFIRMNSSLMFLFYSLNKKKQKMLIDYISQLLSDEQDGAFMANAIEKEYNEFHKVYSSFCIAERCSSKREKLQII